MAHRLTVSTWGVMGLGKIVVLCRSYETPCDAVARSIERRHGLTICGGPCSQGHDMDNGRVQAADYSATLGRPAHGGGWNVVGKIWYSIPGDRLRSDDEIDADKRTCD